MKAELAHVEANLALLQEQLVALDMLSEAQGQSDVDRLYEKHERQK